MFIKFVDTDWLFFCEILTFVINQESHVYSWNLGKIYLVHFLKFWNLPRFTREISKFQKVNSVNLSQIYLLNMWLLVHITHLQKIYPCFTYFTCQD